jgi:hypothetical protein
MIADESENLLNPMTLDRIDEQLGSCRHSSLRAY